MSLSITRRAVSAALLLCLLFAVFSGTAIRAGAVGEEIELPRGLIIGDQDGFRVDADGYYFIDARGLMPGDVIRKIVTIQNLESSANSPGGKLPFHLTMTSEPLFSRGPVDLLDKVTLIMKLDGKEIYRGPSRGDGTPDMTRQPLSLGEFALGSRKTLEITLTVPLDLLITEEKSEADFRWHFYAAKLDDSQPPKTGITGSFGFLLPVAATVLLFSVLLVLKKRREEHA